MVDTRGDYVQERVEKLEQAFKQPLVDAAHQALSAGHLMK